MQDIGMSFFTELDQFPIKAHYPIRMPMATHQGNFFRKSFRFDGFFLTGMTNEQKVVELVKKVSLQQENCLQHVIDFQFDTQF